MLALTLYAGPTSAAPDKGLLHARQGVAALLRGEFKRAIGSYEEALKSRELSAAQKANIYNDIGVARWRLGNTKDAIDAFNAAIKLVPEYAMAYNNRGNALMALDRPDQALPDFTRAIELAPGYGAAYNNRGNAHHALKQYAAAVQDFAEAQRLMPTNAVPLNGRGEANRALARNYAALRDLSRAVALNGTYAAAYRNRGASHAALGQYGDAVDDYTQAITLAEAGGEPTADLYFGRARAYDKTDKTTSAMKDYDKVVELDPKRAVAYAERGTLDARLKDYAASIKDLSRAVELDPDNATAFADRAWARLKTDAIEDGLKDANHAVELDHKSAYALRVRGQLREARFNAAQAAQKAAAEQAAKEAAEKAAKEAAAQAAREAAEEKAAAEQAARDAASGEDAKPDAPEKAAGAGTGEGGTDAAAQAPKEAADAPGKAADAAAGQTDGAPGAETAADQPPAKETKPATPDGAIADYRAALAIDPSETIAREALTRLTGAELPPPAPASLKTVGEPLDGWVIARKDGGAYVATNDKFPKITVPLEMYGKGTPELLDWSRKSGLLKGIGLLRYFAGMRGAGEGGDKGTRLEYVAVVDLTRNELVSIEPYKWGDKEATWNWQQVAVAVTDPDGVASDLKLRKPPPPKPVVTQHDDRDDWRYRRDRRRDRGGGGGFLRWLFD